MAASKNQRILIQKLKKKVRQLERKEQQSRHQLRSALNKMRKLGRAYKSKLASKVRVMQGKVAEAQASTYAKVANDIERQMIKSIEAKAKSLKSAIGRLEKKYISRLTKSIVKKSKKVAKGKKAAMKVKTVPVKMKAKRSMKRGSVRSRRRR